MIYVPLHSFTSLSQYIGCKDTHCHVAFIHFLSNFNQSIQYIQVMKEFKDKAHNLYAIQRKRESIRDSVSKILPLLLNEKIRLFTAGIDGNVGELCM